MNLRRIFIWTLLGSLILGATALWWSPLNQDEGWYLLSAQRVSQGYLPYRDFAYTQGPVLPYVYQGAVPLIRSFGLLGGRLYSFLWSLLSLLLILLSLKQHHQKGTALFAMTLAVSLLGLNPFFSQFSATVKTYSLAGFFLVLAVSAWFAFQRNPHPVRICLCALMLAAAAATRISLIVIFLALGIDLLRKRKRLGNRHWIYFTVAGLLGLALAFGPFLWLAPEGLPFGLWEFHRGREVLSPWLLRASFLSRSLQHLLPGAVCLIFLLPRSKHWQNGVPAALTGLALVSLVHLFAPFPYDEYQTVLFPALVLLLAIELPHHLPAEPRTLYAGSISFFCLLFALSSPQLQRWFSNGQDRIWVQTQSQSDLHRLRNTARQLRDFAPGAGELLTTDLYLAIEARLDVPRGLELGPFSYFPDLSTARAEHLQVLNPERLDLIIQQAQPPLAAISGYGFTIQSPSITLVPAERRLRIQRSLQEHYQPIAVVDPFGQSNTRLDIFRIKE
jgi:hypothetical protein